MQALGQPRHNVLCDTGEEFDINDYWLHDGDDRDGWFAIDRLSDLPSHVCVAANVNIILCAPQKLMAGACSILLTR